MSSLEPVAPSTTHPTRDHAGSLGEAGSERLAGLVWRVAHVGRMAAVSVVIDPGIGDNAWTVEGERCGHAPLIAVGTDLLDDDRFDALTGTLAHELAHRDLAHHKRAMPPLLATARDLAVIGAGYAMLVSLATPGLRWGWAAAALTALALILATLRARIMRLEEFDADTRAAEILDRADLPGRQIVTAMLADADRPYDAWHTYVGWTLSSHPSDAARGNVINTGRLDWRTALCCVATGERLGSRAHRAAHHTAGDELRRCRLSWWHLPPVWWRPIDWPPN